MSCFRPPLVGGENVRPGPSVGGISGYQGPPPPGARQNLPDQRGKETQIFGEEGETGGNAETLYNTLLKLKEKRGCITTKVTVCLLCVCVNYWVMSNSLRPRGLSMGFFRQEYWSGELFPPPGDLPGPGIEPGIPVLQADSLPSEPHTSFIIWRKSCEFLSSFE